ncbi:MAG TPA: hypothetical protein VGQ83_18780 [Polyangia bacterium]
MTAPRLPAAVLLALALGGCELVAGVRDPRPQTDAAPAPDAGPGLEAGAADGGADAAGADAATDGPCGCDPLRADRCSADGVCACGESAPCPAGQQCSEAFCQCTGVVCDGCCDGLECRPAAVTSCGVGGMACVACAGNEQCCDGFCAAAAAPHPQGPEGVQFALTLSDCEARCGGACPADATQLVLETDTTTVPLPLRFSPSCGLLHAVVQLDAGAHAYRFACPDGSTSFLDPLNPDCTPACGTGCSATAAAGCASLLTLE